jgi:hypothetical protein
MDAEQLEEEATRIANKRDITWEEEKEILADIMKANNIESIPDLLEYMKPTIIGNIHDNPELLKP